MNGTLSFLQPAEIHKCIFDKNVWLDVYLIAKWNVYLTVISFFIWHHINRSLHRPPSAVYRPRLDTKYTAVRPQHKNGPHRGIGFHQLFAIDGPADTIVNGGFAQRSCYLIAAVAERYLINISVIQKLCTK